MNLSSLFNDDIEIEIKLLKPIPIKYHRILRKASYETLALKKAIEESDCDIVHIHGFISLSTIQAINICKKLHKSIIYSPHFHPFKYLEHPLIGKMFFHTFLKPLLKHIKYIITINDTDKKFFLQYTDNVTSIPHHCLKEPSTPVGHKDNEVKHLLFVGRNESNKGIDLLYKLPSVYKIDCVTRGPLIRKDFILHENISDNELNELYHQSDLTLIPSRYEAFSYVALESLMAGTPIVISDRVEISCYLKDVEGVGIFKYGDLNDCISHIEKTISQKVNLDLVKERFSPKKIKRSYSKIYQSVFRATK